MKIINQILAVSFCSVFVFSGCSVTGGVTESIDYNDTKKARPLDIPPDLSRASTPTKADKPSSISILQATKDKGRQLNSGGNVEVSTPTSAIIKDEGIYRYLEVPAKINYIWKKLPEFFSSVGLSVAESNSKVGVVYTKWAENRANRPKNIITEKLGKVFYGLLNTGQLDKYQAFVEARGDKTRVYISQYGLYETERPDSEDEFYWAYRERNPIVEMEMLKRLAIYLGVDKPEVQNSSTQKNKNYAAANNLQIMINDNLQNAWNRLLVNIPNNGFILNGSDLQSRTIDVVAQLPVTEISSYSAGKNLPVYKIAVVESGGKTSANFEYMGKGNEVNIDLPIAVLVKALNK